ncbi:MAG: tRNA pseudouridine(38-40) synthase TruA, partial [Deferrisomatales bacterium]|nr:tRNA pseudouridine(38-40) synthase TruA [Deferrisomatales bacterium]
AGWQVQDNAPTVQGVVEQALGRLLKTTLRVTASGRTDAGVHALGQVANFRTTGRVPLRGFVHGLNGLLPRDVAVRAAAEVPAEFDSRRSAVHKTYRYFLYRSPTPSAFGRRTSWRLSRPLDLAAMRAGAGHLVGTHDFSAFRSAGCDAPHAVREIHELAMVERGEYLEVEVRGNAFLRNMVRIIVGTLVEIGEGRRAPESVVGLLAEGDRTRAGATAPPQGLFLAEVCYDTPVLEAYP